MLHCLFNPFPNKPWFLRVCSRSLLKTLWEKGEIARNEQFLLFPWYFLPIWRTFCYFNQLRDCRLQILSVWKSVKFFVWERVKAIALNLYCSIPNINSIPNDKILDMTKLRAFADNKLNVAEMTISLYHTAENTVEKRENAGIWTLFDTF